MKLESLISKQNLRLAWQRIRAGTNLQYKRFFREAYLVYQSSIDEYLKDLRSDLKGGLWEPKPVTRVFLPKPSGLQRPLSLLGIEDQIVFQAFANQFAEKLRNKRKYVENKSVFSNILTSPKGSIFFTEKWQLTYANMKERCSEAFRQDYRWAAYFDLAAYYDTISHDLLWSVYDPGSKFHEIENLVKKWLRVWSSDQPDTQTENGIPQGPIGADFLGEAFMLPIDRLMEQEETFLYLRYVDDIRLFAKSENEVRKAVIMLEQECRNRGLIPQSGKFSVRKLQSPEEAMGSLPSINPSTTGREQERPIPVERALKIFQLAIEGKPQKISDKSRFSYVMYRAPADNQILELALRLLPRHPEHIDAFTAYFYNYGKRLKIARSALAYLKSDVPYSYVRGELWHLVARLGGDAELQCGLEQAKQDAKNRESCVVLSWGVMHFLLKCESKNLLRAHRLLSKEQPISRSLLAPIISDQHFIKGGIATKMLKGNLMEQLAASRELQKRSISLKQLSIMRDALPKECQCALKALGVLKSVRYQNGRDYINERLSSLYQCSQLGIWKNLLGNEYEHARRILFEAEDLLQGHYSNWLTLQNSFNEIVIRQFFEFLKYKGALTRSKTIGKNGQLVPYGSLIAAGKQFDKSFPQIANALRIVNNRRNTVPNSHPYDCREGKENKWLSKNDKDKLIPHLKTALDEISNIFKNHHLP